MLDGFGRDITYLRISVTDRCNLRCRYCMPPEGVELLPRPPVASGYPDPDAESASASEFRGKGSPKQRQQRDRRILSYEEITEVARAAVDIGIRKLRITGGEPLVRRGIESLVGMLAAIEGVEDLCMTTNGILLADHAAALAEAGLRRVNVSLDAVDPERYKEITCGGEVRRVFAGIEAARAAGLTPIKLNCVVSAAEAKPVAAGSRILSLSKDAADVARFGAEHGYEVRFIREMDFKTGTFSPVAPGLGGDCRRCNRLRLSSDGVIRPCLFSDLGFSVRELGPAGALHAAIAGKPEAGKPCSKNRMWGIGG